MLMTNEIPSSVKKEFEKWKRQVVLLRFFHVLFGIIAIVSSLIVAAKINSFDNELIEWFAFTAAVSTGLMTGLGLGSKGNRMRTAWRILNAAKIRYENGVIKLETFLDKYEEAEELIGDVKEDIRS